MGSSAAKICARCAYSMRYSGQSSWAAFLSFSARPATGTLRHKSLGLNAEFKRDVTARGTASTASGKSAVANMKPNAVQQRAPVQNRRAKAKTKARLEPANQDSARASCYHRPRKGINDTGQTPGKIRTPQTAAPKIRRKTEAAAQQPDRLFADRRSRAAEVARRRPHGCLGGHQCRGMGFDPTDAAHRDNAAGGRFADAGRAELGLARIRQPRRLLALCRTVRPIRHSGGACH